MQRTLYLVAFALSAWAQTPQGFTGVWKLNPELSKLNHELPGLITIAISAQGSTVTQTVHVQGMSEAFVYRYDTSGAETTNNIEGSDYKSKARWDGSSLVTDSSLDSPTGPATIHERWTVLPGGKSIKIERHMTRGGDATDEVAYLDKLEGAPHPSVPPPGKTAGEYYKNIKVLNALPAPELMNVMRSFNAALGVQCAHCHVVQQWDRDDVSAKDTTRRMIAMTRKINSENFAGEQRVVCNTCHHGRVKPDNIAAGTAGRN